MDSCVQPRALGAWRFERPHLGAPAPPSAQASSSLVEFRSSSAGLLCEEAFRSCRLLCPLKAAEGNILDTRLSFLLDFLPSLQVWGVGGDEALGEALEAREKQREITAAQIHKARQVGVSE